MTTGNGRCKIHGWTTFTDEMTGKPECVRCLSTREFNKGMAQHIREHWSEQNKGAGKK